MTPRKNSTADESPKTPGSESQTVAAAGLPDDKLRWLYAGLSFFGLVVTAFLLGTMYPLPLTIVVPMIALFIGGIAVRWTSMPVMLLILFGLAQFLFVRLIANSGLSPIDILFNFAAIAVAMIICTACFFRYLTLSRLVDRELLLMEASRSPVPSTRHESPEATLVDLIKLAVLLVALPVATFFLWVLAAPIIEYLAEIGIPNEVPVLLAILWLMVAVVLVVRVILFVIHRSMLTAEEARLELHNEDWAEGQADTEAVYRLLFRRRKPFGSERKRESRVDSGVIRRPRSI